MIRRRFGSMALLLPLTLAAADATAQVRIVRDVEFDRIAGVDPNLLSLDVYTWERAEDWPVFLYVHGGGWQAGDKTRVGEKARAALQRGYVFLSANYRLTPDAEFPAHAEDVAKAIAWTREYARCFGGDPGNIFVMGHSAGAHLVALVGADESYLQRLGLDLRDVAAVCPLDTRAYDLEELARRSGGRLPDLYARTFGQDPEFWRFSSPSTYVEADKGIPPMIVAYSGSGRDRDELSRMFFEKLTAAGIVAELLPAPQKTHAEINQQFGEEGDFVTEAVYDFFARFRRDGPPRETGYSAGDLNLDGTVDGADFSLWYECHNGPGPGRPRESCLPLMHGRSDFDDDCDVDTGDFARVQVLFISD